MKHALFVILCAVPALIAAQADPPRIAIEPAGRRFLGNVGPLEKKTVEYQFRNTSKAPIRVTLADLSPGVVVHGPVLEGPIPAGEARALTLSLDPSGFVGFQARNVRLVTDDPHQAEYRLPVAVEVRPDLTVAPERADLQVQPHESPMTTFTFTRETGAPTTLRLTGTLPPYLEPEWVQEGARTRLQVTFRPAQVAPGALLGLESLEVESNAPLQPRFTLYVNWRLRLPVEPSPSRLAFQGDEVCDLRLWGADGKSFRIESAVVEGGGFQVDLPPAADAAEQVLKVRRLQGPDRALLVLRFRDQEAPLKVPLVNLGKGR